MKSAVLVVPERLELQDRNTPSPGPREALVRVKAAGIGGTDLRIYKGLLTPKLPLVLGQEFAGMIEKVGSEVKKFSPGEKVVVEPVLRDGSCEFCKTGDYCLCDNLKVLGIDADGGYSEFVTVPEYTLYSIPPPLNFEEAALVVPTAVAYYAVSKANADPGSTFLVLGLGPIGLSSVQVAKLTGAHKVLAADPVETRTRLAEKLGATPIPLSDAAQFQKGVQEHTGGRGPDIVIEATGNPDAVDLALTAAARNGKVVFAGAFGKPATINMRNLVRKDLTVLGCWLYPHVFPRVLKLMAGAKIGVKSYISHRFSLAEAAKAFISAQSLDSTKVILQN